MCADLHVCSCTWVFYSSDITGDPGVSMIEFDLFTVFVLFLKAAKVQICFSELFGTCWLQFGEVSRPP